VVSEAASSSPRSPGWATASTVLVPKTTTAAPSISFSLAFSGVTSLLGDYRR
jgi:hypothetical protein